MAFFGSATGMEVEEVMGGHSAMGKPSAMSGPGTARERHVASHNEAPPSRRIFVGNVTPATYMPGPEHIGIVFSGHG